MGQVIGIYQITSPSGKVYIGQSRNIEKRKKHYKSGDCKGQPLLYNSIKKHGWDNHKFEVVNRYCDSPPTQGDLNMAEMMWWSKRILDGCKMLNLKYPGSNGKHSEETILKMKTANVRVISEERKEYMRRLYTGRPIPKEQREKISKSLLGKNKWSNERKEHMRDFMKNRGHSDEWSQKSKDALFKMRKKISQFSVTGELVREWQSAHDIERELGYSYNSIRSACNGKSKTAHGFIWKNKT